MKIEIDDALVKRVMHLSPFQSETEAIHAALTEYTKTHARHALLAMRGKLSWQGDLDALRAVAEPLQAQVAAVPGLEDELMEVFNDLRKAKTDGGGV